MIHRMSAAYQSSIGLQEGGNSCKALPIKSGFTVGNSMALQDSGQLLVLPLALST